MERFKQGDCVLVSNDSKHEDQYKLYERWNYCKGADE